MQNLHKSFLFSDRSFINDKGKYYSNINKFISFDNKSYDEEYISNIKNNIYLKYRNSRLILENDYYKYIFEQTHALFSVYFFIVFNLNVDELHYYFVTEDRVFVHNFSSTQPSD